MEEEKSKTTAAIVESGLKKMDNLTNRLLHVNEAKTDNNEQKAVQETFPSPQAKNNERTGQNIFRRLLDAQINPEEHREFLSSISAADITNMFKETARINLEDKGKHIQVPTRFGTQQLSDTDLSALRQFKKDHKNALSIEMSLDWITTYHLAHNCVFSEETWRVHLTILVPDECIQECILYRRKQMPLADIYRTLCENYGAKKTAPEISQEAKRLASSTKNPITLVEALHKLLTVSGNEEDKADQTCYLIAHQHLEDHCSFSIIYAVDNFATAISDTDQPNFFHLYRAMRNYAIRIENEIKSNKRSNIHNIETVDSENTLSALLDSKLAQIQDNIDKVTTAMHEMKINTNKRCHQCGSESHLVRECPQRQANNQNTNTSRMPAQNQPLQGYAAEPCIMHPGGTHMNAMCILQKGPCNYKPSHGGHSAGMCRRSPGQQGQPSIQSQRGNFNSYQPWNSFQMGNPFQGNGFGNGFGMNAMMMPDMGMRFMQPKNTAQVSHMPTITDSGSSGKMDEFLHTINGAIQSFNSQSD